jgi:hypothetical protein
MSTDPIGTALQSVDHPRMPDQTFADQLLERIMADLATTRSSSTDPLESSIPSEEPPMNPELAILTFPIAGPANRAVTRPVPARPRRYDRMLIGAAILGVILGAGALFTQMFGPDSEPEHVIPAAVWQEDELGTPDPTVELLFADTIDPAEVDASEFQLEWNKSLLSYMELEPGVTYSGDHPSFFCCHGLTLYEVLDGSLTIETDGSVLVYRAGAGPIEPERAGLGTPVVLTTGDAAVHEMSEPPAVVSNVSTLTTTYLVGYVYKLDSPEPLGACCTPEGYDQSELAWAQTFSPSVETTGPVPLSVLKITFEPGATLDFDPESSQVLLGALPSGRLQTKFLNEDGTEKDIFMMDRVGPTAFDVASLSANSPIRFINSTDVPIALYLFRFDPPASD